ncbi:fungal-specific transcription factor domain-containing protein [Xylariaceae sp. FL0016]|nr:fungal-specific transcription factor domain-containing protein [Xylariaceae sp. FL0016]
MTRPKVDPDKRQRTAQACDSCKRRKQKCNGVRPCNTCTKRQLECQYTPTSLDRSDSTDSLGSPTKRRHVDSSPSMLNSSIDGGPSTTRRNSSLNSWNQNPDGPDTKPAKPSGPGSTQRKQVGTGNQLLGTSERDFDSRSRLSNTSGAADEAEVYPSKRMLQDSTGRLLYVGDSASLSYLQWIRMIVENISGPSDFTVDPRRHMIMENTIPLPQDLRPTGVLPDQRTANILIGSYFTNTAGFIEVFDKRTFLKSVDECYKDPLGVTPSLLCLLYLVFAIGLVMAAPFPGSDEAAVIDKLRSERASRAEQFFRNAKNLADPVSGFEDADFWSIQALVLMSLYMLSVSKRNASYAYYGMAVRSAFALGLHRDESMVIFPPGECQVRKNLWRTLFVLDRFLAACLGRPTAIAEDDCSESAFEAPRTGPMDPQSPMINGGEATHLVALEAAVKSCRVIGYTLKKVYSKRKISTAVAQEIADHLEDWNRELHHELHWRRLIVGGIDPIRGISILHTNILHCHSVMLLTRPFFLYLLNKACEDLTGSTHRTPRLSHRMETFAQTCVEASQHTLILAQASLDGDYLPQCNPFVIHCVFASALIVLSNEFASLYNNPEAQRSIGSAISILRFCAHGDAQADRVSYIVESFHKANQERSPNAKRIFLPGRKIPTLLTLSQHTLFDPVSHFFYQSPKREHNESYSGPAVPLKGSSIMSSTSTAPASSITSMMPSGIQQPSPEGSVSLHSGGMAPAGGVGPAIDPLSGGDSEFDFDSLWNGWPAGSVGNVALPPPMHPAESLGPYVYGQQHAAPVSGPVVNVPLYPQSDFR